VPPEAEAAFNGKQGGKNGANALDHNARGVFVMALVKLGPMAAAVSGKIGGTVFSHNRGGAYVRRWAKPSVVSSIEATAQKGILATCSRAWATLSDQERAAWRTASIEHPKINRIGESHTLSGEQAYIKANARILRSEGTLIDLPPTAVPPDPVYPGTLTLTAAGSIATLAFTPTPTPSHVCIWLWACVVQTTGVTYVGNKLRLLKVTSDAAASPIDFATELENRFGTMIAGTVVHVRLQTCNIQTGLVSGFLPTYGIIT
jgi:hypothetical protein